MNYRLTLVMLCLGFMATAQSLSPQRSKAVPSKGPFHQISVPKTHAITVPEHRTCFTTEMEQKLQAKYPQRQGTDSFEEALQKRLSQTRSARSTDEVYRIPTIVHVVHNGEAVGTSSNITAAQVNSQFEVLNEDFRRLGAGANTHESGADVFVEFVPVLVDPDGQTLAEPGINRINGARVFWEETPLEETLKPETIWDPERYFNIWVVNFGGDLDGVLGYAQFPSLSGLDDLPDDMGPATTDGVVIGYPFFGKTGNVMEPYDLGRTTTHEVGHWLGLRHIWGDGGCEVDDYCEDTPNAGGPNFGCSANDSCPGDEFPDMIENYMDYSDDACMNIFTIDQKARMRTVLEFGARRSTLIGPLCEEAEVAQEGTNTTTPPMWYTFTATEESIVTVSSFGQTTQNTYLSLYPACDMPAINTSDDVLGTTQSELATLVVAGETVKILWSARNSEEEFNWTLGVSAPTEGAACALALPALEGTNPVGSTDLNTLWYSFTLADASSKIILDGGDKSYQVYGGDCQQLKLITEGAGSQTLLDVNQGDEIFIAFEAGGGDFSWSLAVEGLEAGEACSVAVEAIEGTNTTPSTPYWFTYTMTEFANLTISSTGQTDVATYAKLYDACSGSLISDNQPSGDQTEITVALSEGAEVKIFWDATSNNQGFDWTLETNPFEPGENCFAAITAEEGLNNAPQAPVWFTFTMPVKGNLHITTEDLTTEDTDLYVFDGCEGTLLLSNDDIDFDNDIYQSEGTIYGLEEGVTVKIFWADSWDSGSFDWNLTVLESQPGDACENAKEAVLGQNTVPEIIGDLFWTYYTVPESDKKLVISSSSSETVYVASDCEELLLYASGYEEAVATGLVAGQEILIAWSIAGGGNFSWTLAMETLEQGDKCSNPLAAAEGTNSAGYAPAWYTFTMPTAGNLLISSEDLTTEDTDLLVLSECDGVVLGASDDIDFNNGILQSEVYLQGLSQGETVYMYWTPQWSSAAFNWELTVSEPLPGEACEAPATAQIGTNSVPELKVPFYWVTFTMPEADQKLVITSTSEEYIYTVVDCDLQIISSGYENLTLYDLGKDEEVLIVWELYFGGGFEFELSVEDLEAGDLCDDPIEAQVGSNSMDHAATWYSYTMPKSGDLLITSVGQTDEDTYLYVYNACAGDIIAQVDDTEDNLQSEFLIEELSAGETIYIYWADYYSTEGFSWKLELQGITNAAPVIANQTFEVLGPVANGHQIGTVVATDADGDALRYTITAGNEDGAFALHESNGALTLADVSLWDQNDLQLTIEVTDHIEKVSAKINVRFLVLGLSTQAYKIFPNPTSDLLTIEGAAYTIGYLTDLSGKVVKTFDGNTSTVYMQDLRDGIYLLKLEKDGAYQVMKILLQR